MQITSDLKELSKEKCSINGCDNPAESLIENVLYCDDCNKIKRNGNETKKGYWEFNP